MTDCSYRICRDGAGPIVAAAIHDGHALSPQVADQIALGEAERLREEDPYTASLTAVASTQIVALRSRFEVDFNRPREKAVYRQPADAWGLNVWRKPPSQEMIEAALKQYDEFYRAVEAVLSELLEREGRLVVYDIHSYNHRRSGSGAPPASEADNPEVNIGTGTLDRQLWSPVVDRFIADLRQHQRNGRALDVRENIKFRGGQFSRWIHETFAQRVCAISIEFKKFFMDEWTGEVDKVELTKLMQMLGSTVAGVRRGLEKMDAC